MGTSNAKPIDQFTENVLTTRYEDIDPVIIEQAKLRIIDTVGCLIAGSADAGNREFVELIAGRGGKPEATILMVGDKVPVGAAAMVNCILCRSFDYEPVSPVVDGQMTPGHISGTNVMTALSLSEAYRASGKELLTAMLVGDDMTARILATSGFSINFGWDGNGTGNAFGATAIAGRLMGLSPEQLKYAFGLSVSKMAGSMQNIWEGTPAFKLPQGLSAENGIFSAQLASVGWTGPRDGLLGPFGYYDLYTNGIDNKEKLTKDLGSVYYADRAIKPYPACRATHPGISGAINLAKKHRIDINDVREVIVGMPAGQLKNFCGKPFSLSFFPHSDCAFSYQYTIATAIKYQMVGPQHFAADMIQDAVTTGLVDKVKLIPLSQPGDSGITYEVKRKDGSQITESWSDDNKGDFLENPLSEKEFKDKFMGNVMFSGKMSKQQAEAVLTSLRQLEELENISELIRLLTAEE